MQGELEEVNEEWLKNAESFTKSYLEALSTDGDILSVEKLREDYLETERSRNEKLKRLTEANTPNKVDV